MFAAERSHAAYDPTADMHARHPGWTIHLLTDMPRRAREVFLPDLRTVLVDKAMYDRDPDRVAAHIVAHLDLHDHGGGFTRAEEQDAETIAGIRLDRVGSAAA